MDDVEHEDGGQCGGRGEGQDVCGAHADVRGKPGLPPEVECKRVQRHDGHVEGDDPQIQLRRARLIPPRAEKTE